MPRVVTDFEHPGREEATPRPARPERLSGSIPAGIRQQLEERLGGAIALQQTTDEVLEASASVLARTHAVQVLAEKFPPSIEAGLSTESHDLLRSLRQRHASELQSLLARIQMQLKPLLSTSNPAPSSEAVDRSMGDSWQTGVQALVASARDFDNLVNRLLAGTYSDPIHAPKVPKVH